MPYDLLRHHRRSIRLRGYDYSREGAYFVTICTRDRECTIGNVVNGEMVPFEPGRIAEACWLVIPNAFPNVTLDVYQAMPNHLHGIVVIWPENVKGKGRSMRDLDGKGCSVRDLINQIPPGDQIPPGTKPPRIHIPLGLSRAKSSDNIDWPLMKNPKQTLGKVIRHFKAKATKEIHDAGFLGFGWQRNFHDHIIRNEQDLNRIRKYIKDNVSKWSIDHKNPANNPAKPNRTRLRA